VTKAYTTRVGLGPFPTEFDPALGDLIREAGQEYGATTGRARRCGWLDAVALKYAAQLNGLDELVVTKLDVLDELEELQVATRYRRGGRGRRVLARCAAAGDDQAGLRVVRRVEDVDPGCRRFHRPPGRGARLRPRHRGVVGRARGRASASARSAKR